jgi:soluble lytic murein transglycosylase
MFKLSSKQFLIALGSSFACLTLVFASVLTLRNVDLTEKETITELADQQESQTVFELALVAQGRTPQLETIANQSQPSDARNRARYLLASDLIEQQQGEAALTYLDNLEQDYPLLAEQILFKRAQAYELAGDTTNSQDTLETLKRKYPDSPVVAEVLYGQGQSNPQYLDAIIAQFPDHPRAVEIARQRLAEDPNQLNLLMIVIKGDPYGEGVGEMRDRAVTAFASQLTPEAWEIIASGYWDTWQYGKAGKAYQNAPNTPQNFYRVGRGFQLGGEKTEARQAYQLLMTSFPNAQETGLGLRRLASLSDPQDAIPYLDQVIENFPAEAPQALLDKAKHLITLGSPESATQAREAVLAQYPDSDAAAEYRWDMAQRLAQQGQLETAVNWIQPILQNNRTSDITPKAGFWAGKWAQQIGKTDTAKQTYEQVLTHHPESYYAWRSAVHLGLDVGNFTTVRDIIPKVTTPTTRSTPPAGSETVQELYRLGQDEAAWALWQAEYNPVKATVSQQFTDGLLRQTMGQNLQGINRIWLLQYRDKTEEVAQWQALRETPKYWHALFPFPYNSLILDWSQQRQLNPLLVTSLIRQESRFEKDIRSVAGATGLMQIMPGTGEWVANAINVTDYALNNPEDNIKLGTWYLDHTHQEYNNHSLLAVASYNAGPGNVAKWLREYNISDPDIFVENIPFPETKGYVEAVFGNYWNYLRIYNPEVAQMLAQYEEEE